MVCADNTAWGTDVDDDESSNAGPRDGKPLLPSAMATLGFYKYILPLFFSKSNLNLWLFVGFVKVQPVVGSGSTYWDFGVVEIDCSGWRIKQEQDRKIKLFCFVSEL